MKTAYQYYRTTLEEIRRDGLYKEELPLDTRQDH